MTIRTIGALASGLLLSISPAAAAAQESAGPEMGREFAAVNGTTIRCPLPQPPSEEQQAAQFETRPRDLDQMSAEAAKFFNSDSEIGAAFRARQAEQRATDWPFLCRYRDANAMLAEAGYRPDVVFMGDSITEGWIQADPSFFEGNHYVDRGISGQSSSQMVARFQQDVVALAPRAVHIMAGTNDIGGATGPITEDEFAGNIRAMLDMAQANDIEVVLAAIPPMSRLLPRPEFNVRPVVLQLNARLAELAEEYGVPFVDYYTPMALPDGAFDPQLANDGVHPTRAGYAVMAPLAKAALDNALKVSSR
ncbi:lysophospholipase L1-like esterase [Altererythrobacter atlanticus]|uniref:GDSL-like Lipase/Acylhydrolase n=1 Tax=Croceibacterium atlanticum TaxID=1267766 RepID=A0A0F7KQN8_9SPHN|nr:GDSL-type esterase/lipase family protein [Croceibacterium atlanticum]AKH41401.1 GDSL-like Lipase/Acylhydrolase [Croceibacterium atlanticum]MBB5732863.1 lysophospholipase L1-like esterase [Croceibacterium atlanticum]